MWESERVPVFYFEKLPILASVPVISVYTDKHQRERERNPEMMKYSEIAETSGTQALALSEQVTPAKKP